MLHKIYRNFREAECFGEKNKFLVIITDICSRLLFINSVFFYHTECEKSSLQVKASSSTQLITTLCLNCKKN